MTAARMHTDQLVPDADLVRRLLAAQFPEWAGLALVPVASDGTANAIYRLGSELAVRMPLQAGKTEQLAKEHRWLPTFAPLVPLALPLPLARGKPDATYPSEWTVCRWIEGENATLSRLADPVAAAGSLAAFVQALQSIDATAGPAPGTHNFERGVPLVERDATTRQAIAKCAGLIDQDAATAAWQADSNAATWDEAPVWIHGDLAPGNLVASGGQLVGVIDWGGLGVGDPATELLPAWNLFEGPSREAYREALGVTEATWRRGRGWALYMAVVALPYYLESNPAIVRWARRLLCEVLADHARTR